MVDGAWQRMKIKSPQYVAIHLMIDLKTQDILEPDKTPNQARLRQQRA